MRIFIGGLLTTGAREKWMREPDVPSSSLPPAEWQHYSRVRELSTSRMRTSIASFQCARPSFIAPTGRALEFKSKTRSAAVSRCG